MKFDTAFSDSRLIVILNLAFLILLAGSGYYYLERLNGCGGQDLFRVVNCGDFFLIHNRPIHVLSQWIPLAFLKLGAELKTVAQAFSIGIVLQHYLLFLLIVYWLKTPVVGIGLLVSMIFGVRDSFYMNADLEIQFCISLSFFYYALLNSSSVNKVLSVALRGLVIFIIVNSYLPTTSFLVFSHLLSNKLSRSHIAFAGTMMLSAFLVKLTWMDSYIFHVLDFGLVVNQIDSGILGVFGFLVDFYSVRPIELVFIFGLIFSLTYIGLRKELILFLSAFFGYTFLVVKFYGHQQLEHTGLPLTLFVILTWVRLVRTGKLRSWRIAIPIALGVFVFKAVDILMVTGPNFKAQTESLMHVVEKTDCYDSGKIMIEDTAADNEFCLLGLFGRSVLYSKISDETKCKGVMVRSNVVGHFCDLGIDVTQKEKVLVTKLDNDGLKRWSDKKMEGFEINEDLFPIDDDFVIIEREQLCDY